MKTEMTDPKVVDLFEEMLCERAANGIRPVLYLSSHIDFECSVVMLLNKGPGVRVHAGWPTLSRRIGQRVN